MSKLQMIKRSNMSESYSCNLPLAMIRDLCWNKGDELEIQSIGDKIIISKESIKNARD